MTRARLAAAALSGLALLAACGDQTAAPHAEPSAPEDPDTLVTTHYAVTVLDDGDGAELCLGGVADSLPPQCGGPRLVGWDWTQHDGDYDEAAGVRWGDFVVTGTFDGSSFTPTEVISGDDIDPPVLEQDQPPTFDTPCPEPDGGWRVLDAARTTPESLDRTMQVASRLEGYGASWVDQSRNPASTSTDPAEFEGQMNDPTLLTVNVTVSGDVEAAEQTLRESWGGALCVSPAAHTDQELARVQSEVQKTDGVLSSGRGVDHVDLQVTYDDGTLQRQLDERYGEGVVVVSSALHPVG